MTVFLLDMTSPAPPGAVVIDTTSRATGWSKFLSPFYLGPVELYGGFSAKKVESGYQCSKLFAEHADAQANPTAAYWAWAKAGWANPRAVRYPMGKGREPICSLWNGKRLSYIEARKQIYIPLYWKAACESHAWTELVEQARAHEHIALRSFDVYDYRRLAMSLADVVNNEDRKMGHGFVLLMLLEEIGIR